MEGLSVQEMVENSLKLPVARAPPTLEQLLAAQAMMESFLRDDRRRRAPRTRPREGTSPVDRKADGG